MSKSDLPSRLEAELARGAPHLHAACDIWASAGLSTREFAPILLGFAIGAMIDGGYSYDELVEHVDAAIHKMKAAVDRLH